jgi:hypothetical protein
VVIDYGPMGKKPPKPKKAKVPKARKPAPDPLLAQLNAIYGPQQSFLSSSITAEQKAAAQQAAQQRAAADAYAKYFGSHVPQQIQGIYSGAANQQVGFAKGFSDGMKIAQDQTAGEANKIMSAAGSPAGQQIHPTSDAADVLYGVGGFIPGSTLSTQGAAFASAAAVMPGAISAEGGRNAEKILAESEKNVAKLQAEQAKLLGQKAKAGFDLLSDRGKQATDLYNAGMLTQREYAKMLGLTDWRRYPNAPKPGEAAGIDAAASKLTGFLVDDDGNPILDRKGKPIPVLQDAPEQARVSTTLSAGNGYLTDVYGNPITDKNGKPIPYTPHESSSSGSSGKPYVVYVNGVPMLFDPKTNSVSPLKGAGAPQSTFDENAMAKANDAARIARYGIPNTSGGVLDNPYKQAPFKNWEAAVNYVLSKDEDITRAMAESALWKYRRKLKGAPKKRPPNPKANAALSGGRENASYGVTAQGLVKPLPGMGQAGSWGYADPEGQDGRHMAIDWFAPKNTGVAVPEDGIVIEARYDPRTSGQVFGGTVKVRTRDGRIWVFRHTNPAQGIRVGMRVGAGTQVGLVAPWTGSTHSHVELWRTESGGYHAANMLNPLVYLYGDRSV